MFQLLPRRSPKTSPPTPAHVPSTSNPTARRNRISSSSSPPFPYDVTSQSSPFPAHGTGRSLRRNRMTSLTSQYVFVEFLQSYLYPLSVLNLLPVTELTSGIGSCKRPSSRSNPSCWYNFRVNMKLRVTSSSVAKMCDFEVSSKATSKPWLKSKLVSHH